MTKAALAAPFSSANQHALATILDAAQTKRIIAATDIFDISGIKLWARDRPVSAELQRKLLDRQLRSPLESCLLAEDGVTSQSLAKSVEEQLDLDTPLTGLLRPHAARLVRETAFLPLHSVAQLLLTAGQVSRPESFEHAVQCMLLAGALMIDHGGTTEEVRLAMLGGLLHDLGEMYIDPSHGEADADRNLDFESYQQLVVHPHVGHLLISQLTNYPKTLARAVAEHHERLDGSGYPHALEGDALSPLGRMLAVAESALAVLRGRRPYLARVSVALRVVPGEYDLGWVGYIADGARQQPELFAQMTPADVQARLGRLDTAMESALDIAQMQGISAESDALKASMALAQHLLGKLRKGWYSSGLWSSEALPMQDCAEVEAVEDELYFRLQSIERATRLRAGQQLPEADKERLEVFCDGMRIAGH